MSVQYLPHYLTRRRSFSSFTLLYNSILTSAFAFPPATKESEASYSYSSATPNPSEILTAHALVPRATGSIPTPTPALSTVFIPPSQCQNSLTMLAASGYEIWHNEIIPVLAETMSNCCAPAYMTSWLESRTHWETPAAFSPLVCQADYRTVSSAYIWGKEYIVCCPEYAVSRILDMEN